MNYSFRLKYPKLDKESLIYFTASFKNEGKTFVYSTGENIHPKEWDFKNKRPANLSGRKKDAELRRAIDTQLSRYSNFFIELISRYKTCIFYQSYDADDMQCIDLGGRTHIK